MHLSSYGPEDCPHPAELFYDTIHAINQADCSYGRYRAAEFSLPLQQKLFENGGVRAIEKQQVIQNGIALTNYIIKKKDNDQVSFSGVSWKLRFLSGKLYDKISFKVKKGDIL